MSKVTKVILIIVLSTVVIGGVIAAIGAMNGGFRNVAWTAYGFRTYNPEPFSKSFSNVKSMDVKVDACKLTICEGSEFSISGNYDSDIWDLQMDQQGDALTIKMVTRNGWGLIGIGFLNNNDYANMTITIPKGQKLENTSINTDAGSADLGSLVSGKISLDNDAAFVEASSIKCDSLTLKMSAGKVKIDTIEATKDSQINLSAGDIEVGDGSLSGLILDVSAGNFSFAGKLARSAKIDVSAGKAEFNLDQAVDQLNISASKSAGSIKVNGNNVSGTLGGSRSAIPVNVSVSAGNVTIYTR
ncbi:MAG: DUF4097 domain-containing protein [Coriobacteriales bacterium]|jgi:hypothetical protein|nr:DUF4097 domain-containing protein [Coriobacteriales bacterium]